jgi:urea transport system substrate-binding protein
MTKNAAVTAGTVVVAFALSLSMGHLTGEGSSPATQDNPAKPAGGESIKVGILHSLTGVLAVLETPLRDAELMAIEEINANGGLLGKKIEAIVEDPQSRFTDVFPDKARKLLGKDRVVAVFGCWTSVSRRFVLPVFEENNGLLFYPTAYEGNECSKHVVYSGALPNQQVLPALDWLLKKGHKKFYLLGSDYVFPRTANLIVVKYLKEKGITPLAEKYTPLGHRDYAPVVQDIKTQRPDVIFSTLLGDSNSFFYEELAAQTITAKDIPVLAALLNEDDLRYLDPAKLKGHLAAWTYFQSIDSPRNKEFVKKFREKYGKDCVVNEPIAAAYAQVYLWARAVEKAKSTDVDKVREAVRGIEFDAPEGKIKVDAKNQHVYKHFRLGRIRDDRQFDIIQESAAWIEPNPFPAVAFPGLACDWTKGGVIKLK